MLEKQILMNTLPRAYELVEKASLAQGSVMIKTENALINAKSILGIFTINLLKPVIILYSNEDVEFNNWLNEKYD